MARKIAMQQHIKRVNRHHKQNLKKLHAHHKRAAGEFAKHFHGLVRASKNFVSNKAHAAAKKMYKSKSHIMSKLLGAHRNVSAMFNKGREKLSALVKPKGMTKSASGFWDAPKKAWAWLTSKFHANKHHLHKLKDNVVAGVKKEATNVGKQMVEGAKSYAQKHGTALMARGKALGRSVADKAKAKAKAHVDKYVTKGTQHVDNFIGNVTSKLDQAQDWVDKQ